VVKKIINCESPKIVKIKQVVLSAYSPNLNLIERLRKFMRKTVVHHYFYRKFDDFKKAIFDFLENIKYFEAKLKTLISWNFHNSCN
jgi:hypothetical protein